MKYFQEAVKEFLYLYKYGMLPRGDVFSVYYPKLLKESVALFRLFYYAKDFEVFYKTALWARIYINEGQFICALYNAVIRRPDTLYIQLPPLYEVYPYAFFNSEVLEKAHHVKFYGKLGKENRSLKLFYLEFFKRSIGLRLSTIFLKFNLLIMKYQRLKDCFVSLR